VKNSEHLELDWLLKCNLEELIASVRPMSAKNCEQIVRAILDRIGGPSFEQLLMRIVGTMVPSDGRGPPANSDEYYFSIRDLFPHIPPENDGNLEKLPARPHRDVDGKNAYESKGERTGIIRGQFRGS
jgi:hypothetical protein